MHLVVGYELASARIADLLGDTMKHLRELAIAGAMVITLSTAGVAGCDHVDTGPPPSQQDRLPSGPPIVSPPCTSVTGCPSS